MDRIKFILLVLGVFLISCGKVDAGINICPDQDGPVSSFTLSGSPQPNCHYFVAGEDANYDSVKSLLKSTPKRFLDIVGKDIVKKPQSEIDQILADEAAANEAAKDLRIRSSAKNNMDDFDGNALVLRAFAEIMRGEINILRSQHGLAPRTLDQLKQAIKNKIDSKEVD